MVRSINPHRSSESHLLRPISAPFTFPENVKSSCHNITPKRNGKQEISLLANRGRGRSPRSAAPRDALWCTSALIASAAAARIDGDLLLSARAPGAPAAPQRHPGAANGSLPEGCRPRSAAAPAPRPGGLGRCPSCGARWAATAALIVWAGAAPRPLARWPCHPARPPARGVPGPLAARLAVGQPLPPAPGRPGWPVPRLVLGAHRAPVGWWARCAPRPASRLHRLAASLLAPRQAAPSARPLGRSRGANMRGKAVRSMALTAAGAQPLLDLRL